MIYRQLKTRTVFFLLLILALLISCKDKTEVKPVTTATNYHGKKVLYLDSYDKDYIHNILARNSYEKGLENQGITIRYEYLDAKHIKDSTILKEKALKFKEIIEEWKPDIIIAADDAINKYLISPYYRNSTIPIIFIGVNWSVSAYKYPTDNITGQIEVEQIKMLMKELKKRAKGERIGILTGNTLTDNKSINQYKNHCNIKFKKEAIVDNFAQWKKSYLMMQDSVDILFLRSSAGIKGWSDSEAIQFIKANTKIVSGSINIQMENFVLLSYPKMNSEFGDYAAETTVKILSGVSPKDIPISKNRKAKITINTTLAEKLKIQFPADIMEIAHLIRNNEKILYVNSYHQGYEWGDGIEYGILKSLNIKSKQPFKTEYIKDNLVLKIFRMDTKRNQDSTFMNEKALEVKALIERWNPNIVIVSDDNAIKHLIAKYYKDSPIPFLFCGVNGDASIYGLPTKNITGMVEVSPILELITFLKHYVKGQRIGFLGPDVVSAKKEYQYYINELGIKFKDCKFISNFDEWKKGYIRMQKSVDMLIIYNFSGLKWWRGKDAETFVNKYTEIPTGTTNKPMRCVSLASFSRIPEEQGMWVGEKALEVLGGKKIENIPISRNKSSTKYLNMTLAKKLNMKFSTDILDSVILVEEEN